jgi:hypothetical protein
MKLFGSLVAAVLAENYSLSGITDSCDITNLQAKGYTSGPWYVSLLYYWD